MRHTAGVEEILWPDGAPGALGATVLDTPALTCHVAEAGSGCGIIVCPGGGYRILASDHEGLQVAQALNRIGITAFVLRYRVGTRYGTDISLLDGLRAVRFVRHYAEKWAIKRIGILGFSAGGHLAVSVGTHVDESDREASDSIDCESCRPDFLVPIYAVTNGIKRGRKADEYTPADTKVTANTPPTFLVHTHEDRVVSPAQSVLFYEAMLNAGVQCELHIYGYGEHGVGLAIGDPDVGEWFNAMRNWLRRSGFLSDKPRFAVQGQLIIDGVVPGMAWVTFVPNDPSAPIARVKLNRAENGAFSIDSQHGPTEGDHRAIIHHISEQYPHVATGAYTLDDAVRYETAINIRKSKKINLRLTSSQTPS